jgi:hypothetical protein
MHKALLAQQFIFAFYMIFIRDTTIHRAHGSTLRLLVEAHAFCTLVRGYVVELIAYGLLYGIRIHRPAIGQNHLSL